MKPEADWRDLPPEVELTKQYFPEDCSQGKANRHSHIPPSGIIKNDATSHTKINAKLRPNKLSVHFSTRLHKPQVNPNTGLPVSTTTLQSANSKHVHKVILQGTDVTHLRDSSLTRSFSKASTESDQHKMNLNSDEQRNTLSMQSYPLLYFHSFIELF